MKKKLSEILSKVRVDKINTSRSVRVNGDTPFVAWAVVPSDDLQNKWSISEASIVSIYTSGETYALSLLDLFSSNAISKEMYSQRIIYLKTYKGLIKKLCEVNNIEFDINIYTNYLIE